MQAAEVNKILKRYDFNPASVIEVLQDVQAQYGGGCDQPRGRVGGVAHRRRPLDVQGSRADAGRGLVVLGKEPGAAPIDGYNPNRVAVGKFQGIVIAQAGRIGQVAQGKATRRERRRHRCL